MAFARIGERKKIAVLLILPQFRLRQKALELWLQRFRSVFDQLERHAVADTFIMKGPEQAQMYMFSNLEIFLFILQIPLQTSRLLWAL